MGCARRSANTSVSSIEINTKVGKMVLDVLRGSTRSLSNASFKVVHCRKRLQPTREVNPVKFFFPHCFTSDHSNNRLAYNTLPAVDAVLRSLVCVFFKPLPA
jgi:hypothetical protein